MPPEKPPRKKSADKKEKTFDNFADAGKEFIERNGDSISGKPEAVDKEKEDEAPAPEGNGRNEIIIAARGRLDYLRGRRSGFDAEAGKRGLPADAGKKLDALLTQADQALRNIENLGLTPEARAQHVNRLRGIETRFEKRYATSLRGTQEAPEQTVVAGVEADARPEGDDATPLEHKEKLRETVEAVEELKNPDPDADRKTGPEKESNKPTLAERAEVASEQAAMKAAEEDYIVAYKDFHQNKSFYQFKEPRELKELEAAYTASRLQYAQALDRSMKARLLERRRGKNPAYGKTIERYNRLVRFNEIIKPAAEAKLRARTEALDPERRGALIKSGQWFARKNQELETWAGSKTKARLIRAAGGALIVSGVAGVATGAAFSALFGYGAIRFARSFAGAYLASGATGLYQQFVVDPSKGRSEKFLASEESRHGKDGPLSEASLARMDAERKKNLVNLDTRTQAQRNAWRNLFITAGVGAVTAESLAELFSADSGIEVADAEQAATGSSEAPADAPPEAAAAPEGGEDTPVDVAPEAAEPVPEGTPGLIDEPGEGSDRAFRELQGHLKDTPDPSPALEHFLASDPNVISQEMGEAYGIRGMVTQPGDRFYFDEQQNLIFKPVSGDPQPFITNDPSAEGGYTIHELDAKPLAPVAGQRDVPVPSEPSATGSAEAVASAPQGIQESVQSASAQAPDAPASPAEAGVSSRPLTIEDTFTGAAYEPPAASALPESGGPLTIEQTLNGASSVPAPEPASEAMPSGSRGLTIEDTLGGQGANTSPDAAWTPGEPLPQEAAVFGFQDQADAFYVNAETPEKTLALAQEYGRAHPGARVFFDNTSHDWLGGSTPRVGSIEFDRYGNVKDFFAQALDENRNPRVAIDTNLLSRRIV